MQVGRAGFISGGTDDNMIAPPAPARTQLRSLQTNIFIIVSLLCRTTAKSLHLRRCVASPQYCPRASTLFSRALTRDEETQRSPAAINLELCFFFFFLSKQNKQRSPLRSSAADISHNDSHYSTHPTKFNNNLTFFFVFSFFFFTPAAAVSMTTPAPAATLKHDKHKGQKMDLIDLPSLHGTDM